MIRESILSNPLFLAALSIFLVTIAYISTYILHSYLSIGIILISSSAFFWLAKKNMNTKKEVILNSIGIGLILLIIGLPSGETGHSTCPDLIINPTGNQLIRYFYSPFCIHCIISEPAMSKLAQNKDLRIEKIDIRYCSSYGAIYNISFTPCFVYFNNSYNAKKIYCGPLDEKTMSELLS